MTQKEKVIQVSGGSEHTLILTQKRNVYSMGSNVNGQLGLGLGYENNSKIPFLIDSKHFNHEKIIQICCGFYHSMVLTQEGHVYSWGENFCNQLGHGYLLNENIPKKIDPNCFNNERVKSISTGSHFSFALTKYNKLYAWGAQHFRQLGLGDKNDKNFQLIPKLVDPNTYNNEKILKLSCGYGHTLLLTQKLNSNSSTNLYTCGSNHDGQLGLGNDHSQIKDTFQLVDSSHFEEASPYNQCYHQKIKDIKAGSIFSMELVEQNGCNKLFMHGCNNHGLLGLDIDHFKNKKTPHRVDFSYSNKDFLVKNQIKHIGNGSSFSFVMIKERGCEKSKIYAWGDNTTGQLGLGHCDKVLEPTLMNYFKSQEIISIEGNCGTYGHSFAITQKGKLFTWGMNKYGQLGLGHDKDVYVPQLCCPEFFGVEKTNEKMYNNQSFEDIMIEFE